MQHTLLKLGMTAAVALSVTCGTSSSAQAAVFNYNFSVNNLRGDLSPGPLTGSFSFDTDDLSSPNSRGRSRAQLLSFNFEGFGPEIDSRDRFPKVVFQDGALVGLNLLVDDDINLDGTDVDYLRILGNRFRYSVADSDRRIRADVTYTKVPEPTVAFGLGAVAAGLLVQKRRRQAD